MFACILACLYVRLYVLNKVSMYITYVYYIYIYIYTHAIAYVCVCIYIYIYRFAQWCTPASFALSLMVWWLRV